MNERIQNFTSKLSIQMLALFGYANLMYTIVQYNFNVFYKTTIQYIFDLINNNPLKIIDLSNLTHISSVAMFLFIEILLFIWIYKLEITKKQNTTEQRINYIKQYFILCGCKIHIGLFLYIITLSLFSIILKF